MSYDLKQKQPEESGIPFFSIDSIYYIVYSDRFSYQALVYVGFPGFSSFVLSGVMLRTVLDAVNQVYDVYEAQRAAGRHRGTPPGQKEGQSKGKEQGISLSL